MKNYRVLFLAPHIKQYRLPFFETLYQTLRSDGIELHVLYGTPNSVHAARWDNVTLPTTYGRKVASYWIADRFVYQAGWREIAQADLVITPNEHKLLLNPLLLALRASRMKKVAFWGKGDFHSATPTKPADWLRSNIANAVDWWFPYTEASADSLRRHGVRCGITAIDNAVDTSELHRDITAISGDLLRNARISIGVGAGPVGLYCGNLSPNKDLDFLFAASKLIRKGIPEFSLIIVGNGPQREHVELVAARERFIRYVGPRIGREKAILLKMADVFLLPGAVGLAILDSFAASLPLLTTERRTHGPEIGYLSHGVNGLITACEPHAYADATIKLLENPHLMARLRAGAAESGFQHSIKNMVQNFRRGILACLEVDASSTANVMAELPGGEA